MEKPHKKLKVWQRAMDLCIRVYEVTEGFPKHELYGLASQMRRAAVSIPCNIAEGAARSSGKESAQFYNIARASLSELDTQIEITDRLKYIDLNVREELESIMLDVDRLLYGLWKKSSK
ncbi:MAG: four helix bundle protein [Nitrospirae bacterium]|nr:four helix bundle protein [Nitrospirota bacterium]